MTRHPRLEALSYWQQLEAEYGRYDATVRLLQQQKDVSLLKVQEDMRRYLCLRCAGFLEQVTFTVLDGYLEQKVQGPARDFVRSNFSHAPNLNVDAFTRLIGRFGAAHEAAFADFLIASRKETLGNLLGIRNQVAHGRLTGGPRLDPDRYVRLCGETYDWLVDTFLGDSVEVMDSAGTQVVDHERSV